MSPHSWECLPESFLAPSSHSYFPSFFLPHCPLFFSVATVLAFVYSGTSLSPPFFFIAHFHHCSPWRIGGSVAGACLSRQYLVQMQGRKIWQLGRDAEQPTSFQNTYQLSQLSVTQRALLCINFVTDFSVTLKSMSWMKVVFVHIQDVKCTMLKWIKGTGWKGKCLI